MSCRRCNDRKIIPCDQPLPGLWRDCPVCVAPECPVCKTPVIQGESVDIGVGMQKCSPDYCPNCGWSEADLLKGLK